VKTPGAHFRHVIFGHVGAISRELSALNDLLAHLCRTRREFPHSLDPKPPVEFLDNGHSELNERTLRNARFASTRGVEAPPLATRSTHTGSRKCKVFWVTSSQRHLTAQANSPDLLVPVASAAACRSVVSFRQPPCVTSQQWSTKAFRRSSGACANNPRFDGSLAVGAQASRAC
jgi:hypothetical protein